MFATSKEQTMEFRNLGGSGLKIPALTFGTATFGGQRVLQEVG